MVHPNVDNKIREQSQRSKFLLKIVFYQKNRKELVSIALTLKQFLHLFYANTATIAPYPYLYHIAIFSSYHSMTAAVAAIHP